MEEYDLIKCVDNALDPFGSSVKNAIFLSMSVFRKSDTSEVISDPLVLISVIEQTFSDRASEIEASITHEICKTFDLPTRETTNMNSALSAAKRQLIQIASDVV